MRTFSGYSTRLLRLSILTITLVLLQAVMLPVLNHNTLRAEKKKIILQQADTIEGGKTGGGSYRSVIGNVVFLDGDITLKCDRATDFEDENKIVLKGNVFITDNTYEIFGDNGVYYPDRKVGELSGRVRGRMLDNSLFGKSKKAVLNRTASQIWLYDDAIAWHDRQQVSGDIILLHLKDSGGKGKRQTIDEMQVHGNAFYAAQDTISTSPVVYDQLSGRKMFIRLNDRSKITGITVNREAEILYHLYDENRKPSGINYSSGDMIRMFFTDGTLTRVKVSDNVEGKQYPESMRGERSINLSKFDWRERENPFRKQ